MTLLFNDNGHFRNPGVIHIGIRRSPTSVGYVLDIIPGNSFEIMEFTVIKVRNALRTRAYINYFGKSDRLEPKNSFGSFEYRYPKGILDILSPSPFRRGAPSSFDL